MAHNEDFTDSTTQLERARISLGEALGQAQDLGRSGADVDRVSASLAKAVQNIFTIQSAGIFAPQSQGRISQTMDFLRDTLALLQDVDSSDPALTLVTRTVARILALLYPVSKTIEEACLKVEADSIATTDDAKNPLSLTMENLPKEQEAAPVPLEKIAPMSTSEEPASIYEERRSFHRRIVHVEIGIQSDTNFFTGFVQDISSGGLFLATYDILSIGTELNVNFRLPDGPVLSLDGKVRWVREYSETSVGVEPGMGIQFENLSSKDSKAINDFMSKHPPIFYDD